MKVEHVRLFGLNEITPSHENQQLYRPVTPDDAETIALAESIRERGVLEPLVISSDNYIVSGHRRHCAARLAGLLEVPCRVMLDVRRREG
jgi:ParB-like chromosome segregation protein Spo0J